MKYGPTALIEDNTTVIVVAPDDALFEKTMSNVQEVAARGARVVLMTDAKGANAAKNTAKTIVTLPTATPLCAPIQLQPLLSDRSVIRDTAMRDLHGPDNHGNVARRDTNLFECQNTYVEAGPRLVVATKVSDLIVVDAEDALLICGADASQGVKAIYSKLFEMGRKVAEYHHDLSSRRLALRQ